MVLRDLGRADVEPFVRAFVDDPRLAGVLGELDGPKPAQIRSMLRLEARNREAGERIELAMADPASDDWIGMLTLHRFVWRHRRAEVGFFVVPARRRRGVALEALGLAVTWAFGTLGVMRMALVTAPENEATQRLAERAGFTREGVLRSYTLELGRFVDNVVFSRLAVEGPNKFGLASSLREHRGRVVL